jgi:hypothetical protein
MITTPCGEASKQGISLLLSPFGSTMKKASKKKSKKGIFMAAKLGCMCGQGLPLSSLVQF